MKYLKLALFSVHLLIMTTGCHKKINIFNSYVLLEDKGYCVPPDLQEFCADYLGIKVNSKASCELDGIDYPLPVYFKAESVKFLKDTIITFFEQELDFDIFRISTRFSYVERRGFAGSPIGKSKNDFSFPFFISNKIDNSIMEKVSDLLVQIAKEDSIASDVYSTVIAKGSARIIKLNSSMQLVYLFSNYVVIIPRPLPIGEFQVPNCGIAGDGEAFVWEGLAIQYDLDTIFFPEELASFTLNKEDILKLYGNQ